MFYNDATVAHSSFDAAYTTIEFSPSNWVQYSLVIVVMYIIDVSIYIKLLYIVYVL